MQEIIKVLKLKIIRFDLIDFGTAKSCGSTDNLILENIQRKGGERQPEELLEVFFSFFSIHSFFISPINVIIAA